MMKSDQIEGKKNDRKNMSNDELLCFYNARTKKTRIKKTGGSFDAELNLEHRAVNLFTPTKSSLETM